MNAPSAAAWRCSVCGYIHRDTGPPDWCPVCGAAGDAFETYAEQAPQAAAAPRQWRCLNCNYVHDGSEPAEVCPVCGAPRDRFEPVAAAPGEPAAADQAIRVTIIGAGIAGVSAAESLRRTAPHAEITLVSREADRPYYRLNLTRYLAGEIGAADLPIHPAQWYADNRIELLTGAEVSAISPAERTVALRGGDELAFDKLILAVGAHPFIPPLPGVHREGVTPLRSTADAVRVAEAASEGGSCICIGGGLLGLETAGALARRGAKVTLLEGHGWLMPRQLNRTAGEILAQHVAAAGIELRTGARTVEIVGDERAAGVLLDDGTIVQGDMVVIATGIRPNSYLARRAGLEVGRGVIVDDHLFSSHPDILAAGDVAEHRGQLYGNWSASQYQGSIAGMNVVGAGAEFGGIPRSNTLKVLGVDLLSIGQFEPEDGSFEVVESRSDGTYLRFVFHDGVLAGAILLGDTSLAGAVKKAVEGRRDFSGPLQKRPAASDIVEHLAQS